MLHRGPVVITSLEEDFKKIGLISESKSETVEEEEEGSSADDGEGGEGEGETVEEGRVLRRLGKGMRRLMRTKRTPPSVKAKSRRRYARSKTKVKMARKKAMRNPRKRRRAKWAAQQRAKREGADSPIANLIEEVQDIVSSINAPKGTDDQIKSFANIAIISDLLANQFTEWNEHLDEEYSDQETYDLLAEAAESLADLAEAAAEVATALKEGQAIDGEGSIEDLFKEYMEDMLEGMELYNEAVAQMEGDTMHGAKGNVGQPNELKKKGKVTTTVGEADEDDDEDDDDEDDDEGDEDDDDEDDAEESKKRPSKR